MFRHALRFIIYDKPKAFGAFMGTVMSVFLVGQQAGIFIFLIDAMSGLVKNNSQYIWVVDDRSTNANALSPIDKRIGYELQSIPGVKSIHPLVVTGTSAKFANGTTSGITLVGVETPSFAGGPWNMNIGKREDMIKDGAIITEFFDKEALGELQLGEYFEINGKQVFNAAETKGVRGFSGALGFTTIERARYLSNMSVNKVSAFLVELNNPGQQAAIVALMNKRFFGIRAWEGEEFNRETVITMLKTSGIAISFGTIIVFALLIGFVIIGLTLYSAVIDRIKDYGTLKAIGATNIFISKLILAQAGIIGVCGYIVGAVITELFRIGIERTGAIIIFPLYVRISIMAVTITIALLGSFFAISRITKLEPGQVFRG
ncbi:ABC transporter permease [Chryseobacterium arthrosphaerae]|uniref:ABC transporter permease n=1 Tax=Chryseobacterium arthrosphaerae TaxID=651561 RepID=UPI0023E22560|nr:FtsX-like permease family protein [Chryseobacterium arthrosphaerae]WES98470.1 ABC transporter permease [Chryseobacterium arthrosphaerae]